VASLRKSKIDFLNHYSSAYSCFSLGFSGMILVLIKGVGAQSRTILVAKRVQRFSLLRNEISVITSRTSSFQTTSCGREMVPSSPHCQSKSTILRTCRCLLLLSTLRDDVEIGMCCLLGRELGTTVELCHLSSSS
jgi:hypothetical protein